MTKKPLIIISGPTASGKSALGIRLARDINGEIISADSMQVYRHMNIGTAKVTPDEMDGVVHHMIDICDPKDEFSIAEYKVRAKKCIEDIVSRGKIPIVVGGTCFYIHALLYDTDFDETESDGSVRKRLEDEMDELGALAMHERLKRIDPEAAESIHMNNNKRVIRALEFYELNGYRISEHNRREQEKASPYNFMYIALNRDRDELYRLIDERVDRMIEDGLVREVMELNQMGYDSTLVSMQGIGYKEIMECDDLESAIERIKLNSRHYAKKQFTWIKHEKDVDWLDAPVSEEDYKWIISECLKRNIVNSV